jgi:putative ABC transport system ATP-binding protein
MIKLQNVHYKNSNKIILTDIDLEIERGKKYLVVGPSGSGKTSLLKIMNNLVSVSNGEIFLDNKKYKEIKPPILRKQIALIMQDSILFGKVVKDNFEYLNSLNNKELSEEKFLEWLGRVKLNKDFYHKDINKLSGGEKQRIAIIRTIMNSPQFILADEPFSALDKFRIQVLAKILVDLVDSENLGLVVVSHYFDEIIHLFDKVIFIFKGEIIFLGKPEEFLQNKDNRIINFLEGNDE